MRLRGRLGDIAVNAAIGDIHLDLGRASRIVNLATPIGNVRVSTRADDYAIVSHTRIGNRSLRRLVSDGRATRAIRATTTVGNVTLLGI